MNKAKIGGIVYICDKQTMDCAGVKGCGQSCFHTFCEECAANKDSVKLAKDFFDTFNVVVMVKPTAEKQEDLFEVWLEEKRRRLKMTDWDYHLEVAEALQTEVSDNQLYFIIRHPWRYSKALVEEAELIVESVMGIGAADFIRDLTDEEVYVGGT